MKNLLFCCCIADPWKEVALNLQDSKKYKPVYWIGWPEDSENAIREDFPECIYHDINDAWKGIFPEELSEISTPQLDGFELSVYSSEELMAIKMMERLDPDQMSFSFNERQHFFRYLLRTWINILKEKEIELIIAPSIPHRVFDYALYIAADVLKIKFLTFKMTVWPGYNLPFYDVDFLPSIGQEAGMGIDPVVKKYVEKVNSSYQTAEPEYMKKQASEAGKGLIRRVLDYFLKYRLSSIPKLLNSSKIYWKKRGKTLQNSNYLKIEFFGAFIKGYRFKNNLKKYYESICDAYNRKEKYVFVALHYQPEETSCPSGKIFVDQVLMVEALSKHLPKNVSIFVKEHPSQFNPKMEGQTGRNLSFYQKLEKIDRVKFISTSINSFHLIDNSLAVATLTGTVGVEALVRGKSAIVFGTAWYESLSGVIKINKRQDLESMYEKIRRHSIDEDAILKGLTNIRNHSLKAYHYKGVKEKTAISKGETIENLSDLILNLD
ncbi:hypothetical protein [Gracilimonas sp.]|uniref:capsular polysaccharide export protein, LipB/KpsS family n=1 Tax=Gracilimonas sp. TaxID=1974203 RepID=UPI003BACB5E3